MDLASKETGIENSDMSFISYRIDETDIIDPSSSSHENAFLDNLSLRRSNPFLVENEFIQISDARSVFIRSRKILQKILHCHDSLDS